jgi:hypothetical protein
MQYCSVYLSDEVTVSDKQQQQQEGLGLFICKTLFCITSVADFCGMS